MAPVPVSRGEHPVFPTQDCLHPPRGWPVSRHPHPHLRPGSLLQLLLAGEEALRGVSSPMPWTPAQRSPSAFTPSKNKVPLCGLTTPNGTLQGNAGVPLVLLPRSPHGGVPKDSVGLTQPQEGNRAQSPVLWPQLWGLPGSWGGDRVSWSF